MTAQSESLRLSSSPGRDKAPHVSVNQEARQTDKTGITDKTDKTDKVGTRQALQHPRNMQRREQGRGKLTALLLKVVEHPHQPFFLREEQTGKILPVAEAVPLVPAR